MNRIHVGCAGWALPKPLQASFPEGGSHLARYALRLNSAEINSSFYRAHQPSTYARWADTVPEHFQFSVKVPRRITHDLRLADCEDELDAFLAQATHLGDRLGCLLVQLPPSLVLDEGRADRFWAALRARHGGPMVVEARHPSWFGMAAEVLLSRYAVGRVRADPLPCSGACWPLAVQDPVAGPRMAYYRLHGWPSIYRSAYDERYLPALALHLRREAAAGAEVWCMFDNTTLGAATANALSVLHHLSQGGPAISGQNRK